MGELRREAWTTAALIGGAGALLLSGYDAARITAAAQLRAHYGPSAEATLLSVMPLGVLLVVLAAGAALTRLGARRTFRWTALGSALALGLCQAGLQLDLAPAALGLAFVREVYVVLMIEQLWSFLDSALRQREGKALNGPVTGIGSLGAILGASLVGPISGLLGAERLPLLSIATVLAAIPLVERAYARAGEPQPEVESRGAGDTLGLGPLLRSRRLLLLLGIVLMTRVLSTTVSLSFEGAVLATGGDAAAQDAIMAGVYGPLNGIIAAMQFLVAPLLLLSLPRAAVWVGMPLLQLLVVGVGIVHPSVNTAAASLVLFRAFEYSLFRDTKELFYQPLSFAVRYRTKLLLDVLGHRGGKALLALALGAPTLGNARLVALGPALSVGAAACWVLLAWGMARTGDEGAG